jgi:hypothetical protein
MINNLQEQRKDTKNTVKNLTKSVKSSSEHLENLTAFISNLENSDDKQFTNNLVKHLVNYIESDLPIFNANYREIIKDVCDTFNAPTAFYIPAVLTAISTAIGKDVTIQDCRGVKEKAVLYMCIVASSGVGKTPAIKWCLKPLQNINAKHRKAYEQEKIEAEKNEIEFTENRKSLFITDATIEALISNLEHSKGILYFRDELIGWLKDMNKYRSSGSDDLLFMQMWNSNDTISMERKTQSIFIENPYLNVLGSTQPKRLGEFTKNGASESGFFQRILFTYADAKIEDRTNKKENKELKELYSNLITKIYDDCRSFENEITLQLSENGNNMITNFVNNFIKKQQRLFKGNDLLIEILSKLETYILRFTLIFEVMDTDEINWTKDVSDKSIIKAISTVIYFYYYSQKIIHTNEQNSIYQNDSDRIIHSLLSKHIAKGITFSKAEAIRVVKGQTSAVTLNKHLKHTGKFLYEDLGGGKYQIL